MSQPDDLIERARKYLATLPDSIEGQNGHDALFRAATVLAHGFAFDESTALDLLREYNAAKCAPQWPEKDLQRKIGEANRRAHDKPRGWLLGDKPAQPMTRQVKAPQKATEPSRKATLADLPAPPAEPARADFLTFTDFILAAFRPDELVQIETPAALSDDGKGRPAGKGVMKTANAWNNLVGLDPTLDGGPAGSFVRINPVSDADGKDSSVSAYRHVLLEWDTGTKDEQLARIRRSNLPVTAIVDSGGKSVHAWVRVDAKDRAEYDARVAAVYELFTDCPPDKQNKNPSRFTRLPGAHRGDAKQALIDINQGLPTWDAWIAWKEQQDNALAAQQEGTEVFDLEAMDAFDPKADPTVLVGRERRWLCKGYAIQIVGFAGTGKSTLCMQMCTHWALGLHLFGLQPVRPLRILLVNAENDFGDMAEMWNGSTRDFTLGEKARLKEQLTIVRNTKARGAAFVEALENLINRHKPDVVVVDPLLAFVDFEIADQALTSAFLRGMILPLLQRTGVALVYYHHTNKPVAGLDLDSMPPQQLAYLGAGAAEWCNFARDSGFLFRAKAEDGEEAATFRFGFSKRQSRTGLRNSDGKFVPYVKLSHSPHPGTLRWVYALGDSLAFQPKAHSSPAKGSPRQDYIK
jgi:RecA-family ATPase